MGVIVGERFLWIIHYHHFIFTRKALGCCRANNGILATVCKEAILNLVGVLDIFLMVRHLCLSISCVVVTVAFPGRLTSIIHTRAYTATKASRPWRVLTSDLGKKTMSQINQPSMLPGSFKSFSLPNSSIPSIPSQCWW